ncbi:hypothetical protein MCOR25_009653 [Pyricularia grisea]|uniref:Uncharacterized protein n=1 Tax=Pyricularia grisea TaxID=148305 RepID=A0A6P8AW19_PYRGI|nr:uncharacterized protein PgNI_08953 [Pyricularia grisea]KAI6351964.1 hypothetical protein MCOR25_009653 [Pyricularia grisea]TLD06423.1 hypothetical protein PgNI_08953 [Pyricularia grisea]
MSSTGHEKYSFGAVHSIARHQVTSPHAAVLGRRAAAIRSTAVRDSSGDVVVVFARVEGRRKCDQHDRVQEDREGDFVVAAGRDEPSQSPDRDG